ncbi:MAG: hypothetical protein LC620_03990, partial [Halobacteriales archaeon]|nr:hypothetical protein [Halobacteriales archaeon]
MASPPHEPERVAEATVGSKDWREQMRVVKEWLEAGELDLVRELNKALTKLVQKPGAAPGPSGMLGSIRGALKARPGAEFAALLIEMLDLPGWERGDHVTHAAWMAQQLSWT